MTACAGCGDCCRVVFTGWTKKSIAENPKATKKNREWAQDKLHRISRAEAESRLPALRLMVARGKGTHYYRCDNFDEANNSCLVHDDKPECCAGFPWYGDPPEDHTYRLDPFPRCSFVADLMPLFLPGLA